MGKTASKNYTMVKGKLRTITKEYLSREDRDAYRIVYSFQIKETLKEATGGTLKRLLDDYIGERKRLPPDVANLIFNELNIEYQNKIPRERNGPVDQR